MHAFASLENKMTGIFGVSGFRHTSQNIIIVRCSRGKYAISKISKKVQNFFNNTFSSINVVVR